MRFLREQVLNVNHSEIHYLLVSWIKCHVELIEDIFGEIPRVIIGGILYPQESLLEYGL